MIGFKQIWCMWFIQRVKGYSWHEMTYFLGMHFRFCTTCCPSCRCSPGQLSLFTLLIINMQKDVGHWPLLPWATAVKQKRRKERKLIPAIWGRKGEEEGRGHGRRHALNWHEAEKYQGRSMDRGVQVQRDRHICTCFTHWGLVLVKCAFDWHSVTRLKY